MSSNFSGWPKFTEEEADAVGKVLLSNKVNYWSGDEGKQFEKEFADFVGTKYAVAVANGTVALDLAMIALGIGKGDEVIVTPRTFLASATSIVSVGGVPVFCDVEENSQNISARTIRSKITCRTKAVICVHLSGWPCEMDEICELANEFGFRVIEDCAQAHGARYKGKSVGGLGDIATWSFCQDKIMSTGGEGGMVTTNCPQLWEKAWSYKDHGRNYVAVYKKDHPPGHRWYCDSFGTNWRLTEIQAAIGRIQLGRMGDWHEKRLRNYKSLERICRKFDSLFTPVVPNYIEHAAYRFYAFVKPEKLMPGWSRDVIVQSISDRGVSCMQGICPEVYLEKAFDGTGWRPVSRLPAAKKLGETSLAFLIHPTLTLEEMDKMLNAIDEVMSEATIV